ncbi:hypothetical protein Tco_1020879 [Tanacetum coccineum]
MRPTAPSVPLKLIAFAMLAACASRAVATLSSTSFLIAPSVPLKLIAFAMLAACASRAVATLSSTSFLIAA